MAMAADFRKMRLGMVGLSAAVALGSTSHCSTMRAGPSEPDQLGAVKLPFTALAYGRERFHRRRAVAAGSLARVATA